VDPQLRVHDAAAHPEGFEELSTIKVELLYWPGTTFATRTGERLAAHLLRQLAKDVELPPA